MGKGDVEVNPPLEDSSDEVAGSEDPDTNVVIDAFIMEEAHPDSDDSLLE